MKKVYVVRLSAEEREELEDLVDTGKRAAYRRRHAQILLLADQGEHGPSKLDREIAQQVGVWRTTVEQVRKRCVLEGLEAALGRRKRSRDRSSVLDGEGEAQLVAIACSEPPPGHARWTLRLLCDELQRREVVQSISHETVRRVLKKNKLKPWRKKMWCIPPKEDAAFVCAMEQVLAVYTRVHDPANPVICMDETRKQCVRETRVPLPAVLGHPACYDAEYERNGVEHLLMYYAPFDDWRRTDVAADHTASTWAEGVRRLVEDDFPTARRITLVMDNLNTHSGASLYKSFPPAKARALLDKLEFVYTPKHGSWLNMAEVEFSVLSQQCLDRRIADIDTLSEEVSACTEERNRTSAPVNWRFTTADARIKLRHLYPVLKE